MERKARDSRDSIKDAQRGLGRRKWVGHTVTLSLLIGAVLLAPSWRTAAAIGLMLAALALRIGPGAWQLGPYAAAVAGVVVTRELFLEDSQGRTRAWLGVANEYGDEKGPRLVLYDERGQARLSLRLIGEKTERLDADRLEGKHAEVVPTEPAEDKSERTEPALVMFNQEGDINLSLWSRQDWPAVEVSGTRGHARMSPNEVWVMNPSGGSRSLEA